MSHKDHQKRPVSNSTEPSFPKPTPVYTQRGVDQNIPRGFSWPKQTQKALLHQLQRSIDLARTNPDYQIKHPNECRNNPDRKVLKECHPDARKRICEEHEKILSLATVPDVDRPQRLNRLG